MNFFKIFSRPTELDMMESFVGGTMESTHDREISSSKEFTVPSEVAKRALRDSA